MPVKEEASLPMYDYLVTDIMTLKALGMNCGGDSKQW